jgi:hypothetical protein
VLCCAVLCCAVLCCAVLCCGLSPHLLPSLTLSVHFVGRWMDGWMGGWVQSLERVLYVWAIRHPASGYVQGINDLATPFLVVFAEHITGTPPPSTRALMHSSDYLHSSVLCVVRCADSHTHTHTQANRTPPSLCPLICRPHNSWFWRPTRFGVCRKCWTPFRTTTPSHSPAYSAACSNSKNSFTESMVRTHLLTLLTFTSN